MSASSSAPRSAASSAYLDGFRTGLADGYDLFVEMDSDLSHVPEELPRLIAATASGRDLAWGAGTSPGVGHRLEPVARGALASR